MSDQTPRAGGDYYDELVRSTAAHHQLLSVQWELTYRCNCKCTHCYVVKPGDSDFEGAGPELTTEEAKRVIDQLVDLNVLNLGLSGGEILCRPDFFEIAEYARRKRFALRLFTNGTLIGSEQADRIADLYPVRVEISIYAPTADIHDRITQVPGSFARSVEAFGLLHERGTPTRLKTPLMRANVRAIDEIEALAQRLGAEFLYNSTIVPRDNGSREPLEHRLSDRDLVWLYRRKGSDSRWPRTVKAEDPICTSGLNRISIDPCGEVYPCVQLRWSAGNVREQPLSAIWRTSPTLEQMRRLTFADFSVCSVCDLAEYCSPCPGVAFLEDGAFLGPSSEACRQARLFKQILEENTKLRGGIQHAEERQVN